MGKFLMVEEDLLGALVNCEKCPAIIACTGALSGRVHYETDAVCVAKLIEHSEGKVSPLPTSAPFAERMEELLRVAVNPFDGMEQSEVAMRCFGAYGRQGQKMAGFVLETQQLLAALADIAAAREGEK
jgi:hypothetical protein